MKRLLGILLLAISAGAQTPTHSVTLTVASPDTSSANPGTATVFRITGQCPASGVPSQTGAFTLTSTLKVPGTGQATDTSVVGGNSYCYWAVLQTSGGASGTSNTFLGAVGVYVTLSGTVQ